MEFFRIEDDKGIRKVTTDNPRKKNAWNRAAYLALSQILDNAAKDNGIKAVVLTGVGDFFR
jgi:enoyl-CoA hydratase/carnithine racemase